MALRERIKKEETEDEILLRKKRFYFNDVHECHESQIACESIAEQDCESSDETEVN